MHHDIEDEHRLRAWASARALTVLFFISSIIVFIGWYQRGFWPLWQWYLALGTSVLGTLLMFTFRKMPIGICAAVSCVTAGVILFASGVTNNHMAQTGKCFGAFLGYKTMALATAVIAPFPVWVGITIISICIFGPVIQFFSIGPELRAGFPVQEPWSSIVIAVGALYVLDKRHKSMEMERVLTRMKSAKKALDDMARVFFGLRDLTNTPLQIVELTSKLIANGNLDSAEAPAYLERALVELRQLSRILATYEKDLDWSTTKASFDAVVELEKKLAQMRNETPVSDH
ncbi:MAG: hypothetical protein AB7T49_00985 [Oligoflexales bacterium]